MNQKQSQQKINKMFLESGLPIWSKEGLELFEKLTDKYLVIDAIEPGLINESIDPKFSPANMEKLHQEIVEIKRKIFAQAKLYDQDKRN